MIVDDLFEHAPCGYIAADADGLIVAANERFLRLVQQGIREVVGVRTFASFLPIGDRIYYETHIRPSLEMQHEVHEIALEVIRADGEKVPVLIGSNLHIGATPSDTVTRTVVFAARDRRSYEQELLRARQRAEKSEEHVRSLSRTLQQSFVPSTPPHIPGLDLAGAFAPAGDGGEVGGDFYEIFQARPGVWMIVLGDVSGSGVEAATVTAFVRHAVRALAVVAESPAAILTSLNSALLNYPSERFCTLVVLRLVADGDHWAATVSCGGHPLPLLRDATGHVSEFGRPGSLIGLLEKTHSSDTHRDLLKGESLILFTDGVTESRRQKDFYGDQRLQALVTRWAPPSAAIAEAILADVLDFQAGIPGDDIAMVVVTVLPPALPE